MSASAVFISYSRKDFYFAESLVFRLRRSGIAVWFDATDLQPGCDWAQDIENALVNAPCVVLIVSPQSLKSEYVRSEQQRARAAGRRIIVVWFRGTISADLAGCEWVDFRGSFGCGLNRLTERLKPAALDGPPELPHHGIGSRLPRFPPWVAAVGVTLASLFLSWLSIANWKFEPSTPEDAWLDPFLRPVIAVMVVSFAWFSCASFFGRRMGMTRLVACLATLIFCAGLPLLAQLGDRVHWLLPHAAELAEATHDGCQLAAVMVALGLTVLGVLLFLQPADLLRWCPTGRVWTRYRMKCAAHSGANADVHTRLSRIPHFYLLHESHDAPAAMRLREELLRLGAAEAPLGAEGTIPLLLLTNRTSIRWLVEHAHSPDRALLPFAVTAISLPDSLRWLWRRQWIDFRRWNTAPTESDYGLAQVPEALTRVRLPGPVNRVHHALCALAALIFTLGGAHIPEGNVDFSNTRHITGVIVAYGSVLWAVSAFRLTRRLGNESSFFRFLRWSCVLTVTPAAWALVLATRAGWEMLRVVPAAVFLVSGPFWLLRQREHVKFWFPLPTPRLGFGKSLTPPESWATAVWILVYSLFWMFLLGFED